MTTAHAPIDLNADVGEGFGPWPMGADEALIPIVSSVNVACGFHAGDPLVIDRTIRLALESGAAVGAHPGYPDREGFGRRDLAMSAEELEAAVLYQVAALAGMVAAAGGRLRHVKAHGALYNRAALDPAVAEPIASAVRRVSADLILVGPPGSALLRAGSDAGLKVAAEGFADRVYEADGSLRSRRLPGAVHTDPARRGRPGGGAGGRRALRDAVRARRHAGCGRDRARCPGGARGRRPPGDGTPLSVR